MKKNLLSIVILSLLIVNIVLTAIMMFSVTSTNKKTAAIITDIASIINLELESGDGSQGAQTISIADTVVYPIEDPITVVLIPSEDGKDHYCVVSVDLSLNSKDPDYATYSADLANKEGLIKGEINSVIAEYTLEEARLSQDALAQEILQRVQNMYNSEFIYKVSFREIMFQ